MPKTGICKAETDKMLQLVGYFDSCDNLECIDMPVSFSGVAFYVNAQAQRWIVILSRY